MIIMLGSFVHDHDDIDNYLSFTMTVRLLECLLTHVRQNFLCPRLDSGFTSYLKSISFFFLSLVKFFLVELGCVTFPLHITFKSRILQLTKVTWSQRTILIAFYSKFSFHCWLNTSSNLQYDSLHRDKNIYNPEVTLKTLTSKY